MLPDNIVITKDIKAALAAFFKKNKFSKIGVLVDNNTRSFCYPLVKDALPEHSVVQIKSGEEHKNLSTCEAIWLKLTEWEFDRKALLINLGGGVIGDMGGFCAAAYKRGISFINIPTTLLAQVDASVGGKLGIDFHGFKNHIGFFTQPEVVFIDPVFIKTLDSREVRSGFAEIIKHSLISDKEYWPNVLQTSLQNQDWAEHIQHDVLIKHEVVSNDPTEKGLRKILNFGHTIGHAIESFYLEKPNQKLLHGEAIAIGMICETYLSTEKRGLPKSDAVEIEKFVLSVYGYKPISRGEIDEISKLVLHDKKNQHNIINCTLLDDIGSAVYDIPVSMEEVKEAVSYYIDLGDHQAKV